ncbi:MAG: hypothetical protein A3F84_27685 [Candidatus Handelsmanbacteria bacterium RIFCSPLOWO2_12_FULL_64_10]|uniref:Uncharacterized protein n=1 Tax=Handelsmanbacteria sp. (strain RIFCSPLOWO2_12_FULL_64_10) TaxID=1817868 RepID=A0A1F6C4G9_HANXR|nr:MAG: hypothetical protein A3F84_27685 [Candidatus Handelsmanbacteria bacterium RIFCSPLOWO2_12_FULL_64_10]
MAPQDTEIRLCPCCGRDVLQEDGVLKPHSTSTASRAKGDDRLCPGSNRVMRPGRNVDDEADM